MATYTFTTSTGREIKVNANNETDAARRARDTAAETGETIKGDTSGSQGSTSNPVSNSSSFSEDYNISGDTQSTTYGKEKNLDWEGEPFKQQKAIREFAGTAGVVDSNFLSTVSADSSVIAFWVNAIAYGGYITGDILNDLKRRELVSKGDENAKSLKIIDPEVDKVTYQRSADGQKSVLDTASIIPTFNFQGLLNPELLKYGANMPADLFTSMVPLADPKSQEFKDAVAEVKAKYFDIASASLQADTEQAKAIADDNLRVFKEELEKKYGIALSDNANKAWAQIENLENTFNTRGIAGSGMQNEAIDDMLKGTRKQDQRARLDKLQSGERTELEALLASGSPEKIASKIAQLDSEDLAKGVDPKDYRSNIFKVSSDIKELFSTANLKAKNPEWTDQMIKQAQESVMDANGNYRSTLYKNYYSSVADTGRTQDTLAKAHVQTDRLNKEAKEKEQYDKTNVLNVAPQTVRENPVEKSPVVETAVAEAGTPTWQTEQIAPGKLSSDQQSSISGMQKQLQEMMTRLGTNPPKQQEAPQITPVKTITPTKTAVTPNTITPPKKTSSETSTPKLGIPWKPEPVVKKSLFSATPYKFKSLNFK